MCRAALASAFACALAASPAATQELHLPLERKDDGWQGALPIADGAVGGAARFDGERAHIDGGALPIDGSQPFLLQCRIRTTATGFCTPLMARDGDAVGISLVMGRTPGTLSFEAWSWQGVKLTSKVRIDDGRWHEVEVAYDPASTMAVLLVDGAVAASGELGRGGSPSARLRLGNNIGAHQPFGGDLDEVRFAVRAARTVELQRLAPVLPFAGRAAALQRVRERLLPASTPHLQPELLQGWPRRRAVVRANVRDCLGLDPEPPRPPNPPTVHAELRGDGFAVQRVSWQSWPGAPATGWYWLPDPLPQGRLPTVLCPHGHWAGGAIDPVVQARCAHFARLGWPTLAIDSVHREHDASGLCTLGAMTWNNLRALDWLCERPEVDPARIACTGASGGAQQTYYLMALDDRIAIAAPMVMACYFTEIVADTSAHCGCNHVPRLASGTDVIEMCAVFAPRPVLFGSVTGDWTAKFPQQGLPELQRLYRHLGAADAIESRHADEGHNYDAPMRGDVARFLHRRFGLPGEPAPERAFAALPLHALRGKAPAATAGETELAREHVARRPAIRLAQAAPGLLWRVAAVEPALRADADGRQRGTVTGTDGVPIPLRLRHGEPDGAWLLVVDARGAAAAASDPDLPVPAWPNVAFVDPRFVGEWAPFAAAWRRNGLLLGRGEAYEQAHDIALAAASLPGKGRVTIAALGNTALPALLAVQFCPRIERLVAQDFGGSCTEHGNRAPIAPEFARYGDEWKLAAELQPRCELLLGGLQRDGAPAHCTPPLDRAALHRALQPR